MKDVNVLTIQDFSSMGQCSLSVALPIISAMGAETVCLPTALLSTHTSGFENYTCVDLSSNLIPAAQHIKKSGADFEFIYTGYLGNSRAVEAVMKIIEIFPSARLIVDPAMAENGTLYDGISQDYVASVLSLCKKSFLCLPNVTEACMLAGVEYSPVQSNEYILKVAEKLSEKGVDRTVITGIRTPEEMMIAYADKDLMQFKSFREISGQFHGSGDVFSSVTVGALANGFDVKTSLQIALDYTGKTIELTSRDKSHWYGLKFEKTLPYLIDALGDRQK